MSETKFTKGEWVVNYTGTHWNNPALRNIEINYGSQGECICDTVYNDSDAHLIAAAPEMYEELKRLSDLMPFLDEQTHPQIECDALKYDIDKLLAKARGES